jgi:predicted RNase H-like HicB family nuclease
MAIVVRLTVGSGMQTQTPMTNRTPFETHNVSGYRVDLYHGEDGGIVVEVPEIEGCITQGKDREEALANAAEAIAVSVEPDSQIAQLIAERDEARASVAHLTTGIASIGDAIGLMLAMQQKRAAERPTLEATIAEQAAEITRLREVEAYLEWQDLPAVEASLRGVLGTIGHITTMADMVCKELLKARAEVETQCSAIADMGSAMGDLRRQRDRAHAEVARLIVERDEYRTSALAGIEAVKQSNQALREAADSIAKGDTEVERLRASMRRAWSLLDSGLQGPRHQRGDFWAAHKELSDALKAAD